MERTFTARVLNSATQHTNLAPDITVFVTKEQEHLYARACSECLELIDARARRCTYCTAQLEPVLDKEQMSWLDRLVVYEQPVTHPALKGSAKIHRSHSRSGYISVRPCPICRWPIDATVDHCVYCKKPVERLLTQSQIDAYMKRMVKQAYRQALTILAILVAIIVVLFIIATIVEALQ